MKKLIWFPCILGVSYWAVGQAIDYSVKKEIRQHKAAIKKTYQMYIQVPPRFKSYWKSYSENIIPRQQKIRTLKKWLNLPLWKRWNTKYPCD